MKILALYLTVSMVLSALVAALLPVRVDAQTVEPEVMALYPTGVPGKAPADAQIVQESVGLRGRISNIHDPTITLYRPDRAKANGAAVVICPGGGYSVLANRHEGTDVAAWLNSHGVTAVLLKYRIKPYRHPVPMMDVQRAVQVTRALAEDWGIDPQRIGVLGFSAGGHLASTASTHLLEADPEALNPVLRVSSRPDFAVLVYPVIKMGGAGSHVGSARNLLGPDPDAELVQRLSSHLRVTEQTPPTLLIHSRDDRSVPITNSEVYLSALHANGVSGTLIEFGTGGHGYGLGRANGHETSAWPGMCIAWMKAQGFVPAE
ncbi:MAG: alpha/beta hydrolase [Planctomycetota bacterium]